MRNILMIALICACHLNGFSKSGNALTEKFHNWFNQKQRLINQQLEQNQAKKAGLEKTIKGLEEKLDFMNTSNTSIQTKLPLIKELQGYKTQLNTVIGEIDAQQFELNHIDLSTFSKSSSFQECINEFSGLTTLEKMELEQEVVQVGKLQHAVENLTTLLEEQNLSWDELMTAKSWDDLWLESTSDQALDIQNAMAEVMTAKQSIHNIELEGLLENEMLDKVSALTSDKINLPIDTSLLATTSEGINLKEITAKLAAEKASALHALGKKHKVKEIDHEDYKEVVFEKKQTLKEKMFVETDVNLLQTDQSLVNVSSLVGMQVSKRVAFGLGTSYQNMDGLNQDLSGLWSGRLMTRVNVWKDIVALQVEGLSTLPSLSSDLDANQYGFSQLIGTRLNLPMDSKFPLHMTFMHNLNNKVASPAYAAPWQMKLGLLF